MLTRMWEFEIIPEKLRTIFNKREIQVLVIASLFITIHPLGGGLQEKVFDQQQAHFLSVDYLTFSRLGHDSFSESNLQQFARNWRQGERCRACHDLILGSVFLVYLGGPDTITAYSLQDNMLRRRQAITLVSQVFCSYLCRHQSLGKQGD